MLDRGFVVSQGAAYSDDMTYWFDFEGHEGAKTIVSLFLPIPSAETSS